MPDTPQLILDLTSRLPVLDDAQVRRWAGHQTVMISSTMRDLQPEREAVAAAIRDLGAEPRFFEAFSSPDNPAQVYNPEVARGTVYLFIAGERYGDPVPGDRQARSATHIEYDTAYAAYKPILAYNKTSGMDGRQEGMHQLVRTLEDRHTVRRFAGVSDLQAAVRAGMIGLATAQSTIWVRLGLVIFPVQSQSGDLTTASAQSGWGRDQSQLVTFEAQLTNPQILGALSGMAQQRVPLTLAREVFEAGRLTINQRRDGRFAAGQTLTLEASPAQTEVMTLFNVSDGLDQQAQLQQALGLLLFGETPPGLPNWGHSRMLYSWTELQPIGPRLGQLQAQLAASDRDAEMFVPLAELLLTDRLLRGTQSAPALLSTLEELHVSPIVDGRMQLRLTGTYGGQYTGSHIRVEKEGVIDIRTQGRGGIDAW